MMEKLGGDPGFFVWCIVPVTTRSVSLFVEVAFRVGIIGFGAIHERFLYEIHL